VGVKTITGIVGGTLLVFAKLWIARARAFVASPRQRLLGLEQLEPRSKPLFTCSGPVIGHCFPLSCVQTAGVAPAIDDVSHRWHESGNRRGRDDDQDPESSPSVAANTAAVAGLLALVTTAERDTRRRLSDP
jgi:hypothetical protein